MKRHIKLLSIFSMFLLAGCTESMRKARQDFGDFGGRLMDLATGKSANKSAAKMEDPYFADERREGINRLSARQFGQSAPYTTRYQQIAQLDENPLVRATAIRALNRARDVSSTAVFVKALDDTSRQVRLEAAKALANVPDQSASGKLLRLVSDEREDRDVRISAAEALRHYKTLEVARGLINQLNQREFGLAWQAQQSLKQMTGGDLKYDESAWLTFITGPDKPLG